MKKSHWGWWKKDTTARQDFIDLLTELGFENPEEHMDQLQADITETRMTSPVYYLREEVMEELMVFDDSTGELDIRPWESFVPYHWLVIAYGEIQGFVRFAWTKRNKEQLFRRIQNSIRDYEARP